jgi:hypothetical protein
VKKAIAILNELTWTERHGSGAVFSGKLKAETTTDYLAVFCPSCGTRWSGGTSLGLEGVKLDPKTGEPNGVLFRFACYDCGFRDYFKVPVTESGPHATPKVRNPHHWYRSGTGKWGAR